MFMQNRACSTSSDYLGFSIFPTVLYTHTHISLQINHQTPIQLVTHIELLFGKHRRAFIELVSSFGQSRTYKKHHRFLLFWVHRKHKAFSLGTCWRYIHVLKYLRICWTHLQVSLDLGLYKFLLRMVHYVKVTFSPSGNFIDLLEFFLSFLNAFFSLPILFISDNLCNSVSLFFLFNSINLLLINNYFFLSRQNIKFILNVWILFREVFYGNYGFL